MNQQAISQNSGNYYAEQRKKNENKRGQFKRALGKHHKIPMTGIPDRGEREKGTEKIFGDKTP